MGLKDNLYVYVIMCKSQVLSKSVRVRHFCVDLKWNDPMAFLFISHACTLLGSSQPQQSGGRLICPTYSLFFGYFERGARGRPICFFFHVVCPLLTLRGVPGGKTCMCVFHYLFCSFWDPDTVLI